jgi:UrcA family protein
LSAHQLPYRTGRQAVHAPYRNSTWKFQLFLGNPLRQPSKNEGVAQQRAKTNRADTAKEHQMNKHWRLIQAMTVAAVFTSLSFTAMSDEPIGAMEADEPIEEVIVKEGPIARRQEGLTTGGLPVNFIKLTRRVSYADLDLSAAADEAVFRKRIETAAKMSCEELAEAYPVEFWGRKAIPRCIEEAVDRSENQVLAIIADEKVAKVAAR